MKELPKNDFILFRTLALMLIVFLWLAFFLTLMSVFYTAVLWGGWAIICGFFFYKKILIFPKPSKELSGYILTALIFAGLIAIFTEPTIFAGRDQGSIAETALRLEENHTLLFKNDSTQAFFEIYGRGKALNFPGFHYLADGSLITQFPLPYITFLAGFVGALGITGFIIANFILTFFFVFSLAILVRYLLTKEYTIVFLALLLTSFAISYFAKFTLSENLAGALLWTVTFLFLRAKDDLTTKNYFVFFLALAIFPFIRLEGIWFFLIFTILFFRQKDARQFVKKDLWNKIVFPLTLIFSLAIASFIISTPFYSTMAKVFLGSGENIVSSGSSNNMNYLLEIYSLYGLFFILVLTSLMCLRAALRKEFRFLLLPVAVTLPLFIYYFSPQISLDHPWMLRRFSFALLPATLILSVVFIATISKGRFLFTKYILIFLLLLVNLPVFFTFFTYRENIGLQEQVHEFAKQFTEKDLILIDKNVAGNGWSMITTPLNLLENKSAVYFFNPEDFAKLNTEKFERVFLVAPNINENRYREVLQSQMVYYNEYSFSVNQLEIDMTKSTPVKLPAKKELTINGTIWELKK